MVIIVTRVILVTIHLVIQLVTSCHLVVTNVTFTMVTLVTNVLHLVYPGYNGNQGNFFDRDGLEAISPGS